MRNSLSLIAAVLFLGLVAGETLAQQMQEMQSPMPMRMEKVPHPDLLITTFEKQVVLPDGALAFEPTGMGEKFFAKLIGKVDFGHDVWFSIRKARIPKGGNVDMMRMTEICYIEKGLGLLIDEQGEMVKAVPAGSWFTVPTDWVHTLKSIGEEDLIMTVIRVGPKELHWAEFGDPKALRKTPRNMARSGGRRRVLREQVRGQVWMRVDGTVCRPSKTWRHRSRYAQPRTHGRWRARVILCDFVDFPQHFPALPRPETYRWSHHKWVHVANPSVEAEWLTAA